MTRIFTEKQRLMAVGKASLGIAATTIVLGVAVYRHKPVSAHAPQQQASGGLPAPELFGTSAPTLPCSPTVNAFLPYVRISADVTSPTGYTITRYACLPSTAVLTGPWAWSMGAVYPVPASAVTGLASVATTGAYSSLTGLPTIPVANPTTSYTFPAANLLALGTYTKAMTVTGVTAAMAGTCGWVGDPGTAANVTILSPVAGAGSATIGYKNNAVLGTGTALTLKCEFF